MKGAKRIITMTVQPKNAYIVAIINTHLEEVNHFMTANPVLLALNPISAQNLGPVSMGSVVKYTSGQLLKYAPKHSQAPSSFLLAYQISPAKNVVQAITMLPLPQTPLKLTAPHVLKELMHKKLMK